MSSLQGACQVDSVVGRVVLPLALAISLVGLRASEAAVAGERSGGAKAVTNAGADRPGRALVWRPRAGSVLRFDYATIAKSDGGDELLTKGVIEVSVRSVSKRSVAETYRVIIARLLLNGVDATGSYRVPFKAEVTRRPDGVFLQFKGPSTDTDMAVADYVQKLLVYPAARVVVGARWQHHYVADAIHGVREALSEFTYEGDVAVGGVPCCRVTFRYRELAGAKPRDAAGTFWVRQSDGSVTKLKIHQDYWSDRVSSEAHQDTTMELKRA